MAPNTLAILLKEILAYGSADWLYFAEVNRMVALALKAPADRAALDETVEFVRHMLSEGLVVIGELPKTGRNFHMWPGGTEELISRIREACREIDHARRPINMGDVCWLAVTPRGMVRGAQSPEGSTTP